MYGKIIQDVYYKARTSVKFVFGGFYGESKCSKWVCICIQFVNGWAHERKIRRSALVYDVCRWYGFGKQEYKSIGSQAGTSEKIVVEKLIKNK